MPLVIGTSIGAYQIVAPIGAGGMGEVYRAHDAKLHRDVAIKILPALVAADSDRRARFEREAQALAAMNHPHIAAVYGFEESGGLQALVLELVEGPTLAERLSAGSGLPIDEAVAVASQIADALEAAHEKGIIHRDLKPANVKMAADGRVKVLDFGLAKMIDTGSGAGSAGAAPILSMSPTLTTPAMTLAGTLLGTAAYMAPEQARGATVDKRADIWAFGVLLFEMLSGRQLFQEPTVSDTVAAVLRQEIEWTTLPATTPPSIAKLLRRCLERDPRKRLRDIGEARIVLEHPDAPQPSDRSATTLVPPSAPATTRARFGAVHFVTALLFVGLVAVSVGLWRSTRARDLDVVRASATLPAGVTFDLTTRSVLAVSRDGSRFVVVGTTKGTNQLYVRTLSEFALRPLPGSENATGPFFSPDGSWIGFFAEGKLKKTPSGGGPVIALAASTDNSRGGLWTERDTIIFTPEATGGIAEIPAGGGTPKAISTVDEKKQERTHRWPFLMPDGKTVLFNVGSFAHPDDYDEATIESVRLDTGERRLVMKGGRVPRYTATGDLLFLRGKVLYAVAFDPSALEVRGSPRPVIDGVSGDTTTGAANYAVADNGTLAYVAGDPTSRARRLAWLDMKGNVEAIDVPPALYADPRVSPDGRRLVVSILDASNSSRDIWMINTMRGTSSRLTFKGVNRTPVWSPNGQRVYYVVYDPVKNVSTIAVRAADGSGDAARVSEIPGQVYLYDASRDARWLSVTATNAVTGGKGGVFRVALEGDTAREPQRVASSINSAITTISPDGRWLAYAALETDRPEVYVQSFLTGGGRSQVSTNGGIEPRWAPDGRALYYQQGDKLMMVTVEPGAAFVAGRPRALFGSLLQLIFDTGQTYDVAPSGDRFLMMRAIEEGTDAPMVQLALNWFTDLRGKR